MQLACTRGLGTAVGVLVRKERNSVEPVRMPQS
jgi:hypothetical protein